MEENRSKFIWERDATNEEQINRLKRNLMVHSVLYYCYDQPLIEDSKWDQWALELVDWQDNKNIHTDLFSSLFKGWNGSTGYHLIDHEYGRRKAEYLLQVKGKI